MKNWKSGKNWESIEEFEFFDHLNRLTLDVLPTEDIQLAVFP